MHSATVSRSLRRSARIWAGLSVLSAPGAAPTETRPRALAASQSESTCCTSEAVGRLRATVATFGLWEALLVLRVAMIASAQKPEYVRRSPTVAEAPPTGDTTSVATLREQPPRGRTLLDPAAPAQPESTSSCPSTSSHTRHVPVRV